MLIASTRVTAAVAFVTGLLALTSLTVADTASGHPSRPTLTRTVRSTHQADDPVLFRFVEMPDFLNSDIGDLRTLPTWKKGDPNSWNRHWKTTFDQILGAVKREKPAFVLDAGDLVEGHWVGDPDHTGIFGRAKTELERLNEVGAAGTFYYGVLKKEFADHDLRFYPAVGDHDIGDNPWKDGTTKLASVPTHMAAFAQAFIQRRDGTDRFRMHPDGPSANTAYAFRYSDTLFVTVDSFYYRGDEVETAIDPDQLSWLNTVFRRARANGVTHIVVQGHLPVLGSTDPVIPKQHSSGQFLDGGSTSAFWQLLRQYHVDLYLAGEMHALSEREDGVTQVVSGAPPGKGIESYVVGTVRASGITLQLKQFTANVYDTEKLWQVDSHRPFAGVGYPKPPALVATYEIPTYTD